MTDMVSLLTIYPYCFSRLSEYEVVNTFVLCIGHDSKKAF